MNIAEYTAYFHDGDLIDIVQKDKTVEFSLISAEIPENVNCDVPMDADRLIRGILVVSGVKEILIDGTPTSTPLTMKFDQGDVFDFEIEGHTIRLTVIWSNCRPKGTEMTTFTIEVQGNSVQWIPKLDLANPMDMIEPPIGYSGHRVGPHYHMLNPNGTGRHNKYLDKNGLPVSQGSKNSRLTPPERYSGNAYPAENTPLKDGSIKFFKYAAYFHDGSLIRLNHVGNTLRLTLISAEINEQDRIGDIPLSADFRLKGILSLDGVKNITVNKKRFVGTLKMESEETYIYNLEITEHRFELNVKWEKFTPKLKRISSSIIELEFDRLYWENKPNLEC